MSTLPAGDDDAPNPQADASVGSGYIFNHTKFPYVKTTARINVGDEDSGQKQFESDDISDIYAEDQSQTFSKPHEPLQFFDCEFYPYTAPGVDPVFVVTGGAETIVMRPMESDTGYEMLRWWHDDNKVNLNSCTWAQDENGAPLVVVSGKPAPIKVFDVQTEALTKEVTDLATYPLSPMIIASASIDHSIRFWSLDSRHEKQPCLLILAGEGHKEGIITLAFHPSGKYLISGGMDAICIWTIPDLPNKDAGRAEPTVLHYPHWCSNTVHVNYVDCISFLCHNLILSKSAESHTISLWTIPNFPPAEPPEPSSTPSLVRNFSSFASSPSDPIFQRLLTFDAPEMTGWYMRFSAFTSPNERPVLGIGNEKSKMFFWDLQSIEEWSGSITPDILEDLRNGPRTGPGTGRGRGRSKKRTAYRSGGGRGGGRGRSGAASLISASSFVENRESSILSGGTGAEEDSSAYLMPTTLGLTNAEASSSPSRPRTSSATPATWSVDPPRSSDTPATTISGGANQDLAPANFAGDVTKWPPNYTKFSPHDPWMKLKPHAERVAPKVNFAIRQMAWSVGGEWCVVVGDEGMICILGRP